MRCPECGMRLGHKMDCSATISLGRCSGDWHKPSCLSFGGGTRTDACDTKPQTSHSAVNHPGHYTSHPSGVECITITRHMTFNCGNAVKYLWRNGLKDGNPSVQDLKKAKWYIEDEIKRLEGGQ